jgi:hypothetical protein
MKNVLKIFGLMLFCICFSGTVFAQSENMDKLFRKYEKKRHFEKFEYGDQKPVWLNLIAHNASFVKILTCDAKPKSCKYKRFNKDIRKSMENFNIVFELNEGDYLLKICATEKDEKGCSDYVIVTRLGDKERVIWLYGRTNIKKFIEYVKEALM